MSTDTTPTGRGRPTAGTVVAVAAALALLVLTAVLDLSTSSASRAAAETDPGVFGCVIGLVLVVAGVVIREARPGHVIGALLVAFGFFWSLDGLAETWGAHTFAGDRIAAEPAFWFVDRFGSFLLMQLPLLLVLYPTGRFMAGRWGTAGRVAVVMSASLPVMLLVAPTAVLSIDGQGTPTDVLSDATALPLPVGIAEPLLAVSRLLTLAALLVALAVVFARHRRADDAERSQLRWLLWAAVICLMQLGIVLVFRDGMLVYVAVGVAVITTAVSICLGIVRPDIADIDALVAGTLVYAGVAAAVILLDFAALALLSQALGDRLDQREVTVVVIVLAVAAYGPLRTWIGAAVRRGLFGRRGDRYQAVSSLAARLETAERVEDQLPALVSAVASTFKVGYVRVEVFEADGGTLSAEHGSDPGEVQEIGIDYHGEPVGRLVLPRQGVRAMLSRRDQALLVDLVRQAAIAVRSTTLARELQESRERLVLAREEDRRRIRRDLHDGLGPVLGGVAMRLDAAGNAVEADPESARRLIRQSRTEIREALDDVRRLVHDLRPPALDDLGLLAAVRQQAERASSELRVDVDADDLDGLPAAVEVAAYRIVSESLANVVRHAGASRCVIRLEPGETMLEIVVRDDGRGIAEDVVAGVGLLSLRERAEELGGQTEVSCPESGGTQVRAWLPYGRTATERRRTATTEETMS